MTAKKRLYLSRNENKIAGVCGGLADYFDVDVTLIRLAFVLFSLLGGPGLLLYIALWIVLDEEPEHVQAYVAKEKRKNNDSSEYAEEQDSYMTM